MAASTDITPKTLFHGQATTGAVDVTTGPSTAYRWIVTALYVTNLSSADVTATIGRKFSTSITRYHLFNTTIEANTGISFGPLVLSSTGAGVTINASVASAIDVMADGYEEAL